MQSGIYNILNKETGKLYIGSAINIERRLSQHKSSLLLNKHDNNYLQRAVNKYGISSFEFVLLEEVKDKEKLIEREQFWIDDFKKRHFSLYNLRLLATSNLGLKYPHSPETKEQISNTMKLKIKTKDHLNNIAKALTGKKLSEEHKKNLSLARTGKKIKTHCLKGHERTPNNINKYNACIICKRIREKGYYK